MARKEDVAELATRLMNARENIRNLGIVAHIDHGKCVSGNSKLFLTNGEIIEAKTLYDLAVLNGSKVLEDGEKTVYTIQKPTKTFSINKKTGKIESKKISHAWKLNGGQTVKVRLENGFEISTTPEHKYLVFDGINFLEKKADELTQKERLVCARKLDIQANFEPKKQILKNLAKEQIYANLLESYAISLKNKILDYGVKKLAEDAAIEITPKSLYHGLWQNRVKLAHLVKIAQIFELDLNTIYDNIETIYYRNKSKNSIKINLPQNFENLFFAAGLFLGDGTGNKFVVGKPELANKLIEICKECGFNPVERNYAGKTPEICTNKTFQFMLKTLFDYPLKKKSHNISLSNFAKTAPNNLLSKLLQAYFDCDGTVEIARDAISISTVSKKMLEDLKLAMPRFGIVPIINEKKSTLYISGESAKAFVKEIGFSLETKQQKAIAISMKIVGSTVSDLVPINGLAQLREQYKISKAALGHHYYKYENQVFVPTRKTYGAIMKTLQKKAQIAEKDISNLAFIQIKSISEEFEEFVYDFSVPENHNFLAEGIFIHNTTLSDNLVAASGLISQELAGKQQFMDYYWMEQERGITINAANVSLVRNIKGIDYLINLIDTPGHIDFGGEVIRAMRAVDGIILVVDSVEGVMPQTETVIRQALKENVKPVLFINKIDRLVNELQLTEQQMQERFVKTITQVNNLILKNAPKEFTDTWLVKVQDGSVTFGSAYHNWAVNINTMTEKKIGFKDVYQYCKSGDQKTLAKLSPLYEAVLEMVVLHLPNPIQAQKYRIAKVWSGDLESEEGKSMIACDSKGVFAMMVTDITVDAHAGDIATGRIYSGTARRGTKILLVGKQKEVALQQVCLFMGPDRVTVEEVPAGNIAAIVGLKEVYAGETISDRALSEFESFKSTAEPVMTISIEAKQTKDLPKLIEVIKQITKEDPNIRATINQETGEHLLSGMGELHLEVAQARIEIDHKVPISVSQPIVVYRETINKQSPEYEGKSPNKHNKVKMQIEPISKEMLEKLIEAKIQADIRPKDKELMAKLEAIGFEKDYSKKIWSVYNNCVIGDMTRGIESLHEIKELVIQGFKDAMDAGALAGEKCFGIRVNIMDANLHEDAIHRGPAQMLPLITRTIYACMLSSDPIMLEPKQILFINVPQDYMGGVSKELGSRRTQITEMRQEGDTLLFIAKAPVKELIGFSSAMRGATQGRAIWTAEYAGFEQLPRELQKNICAEIRKRKGMDPEPKPAQFFLE